MAERDSATAAFLVKGSAGSSMQNPLLKIARDAAAAMVRYASEFGLTPVARAHLAASDSGKAGKFDGLLNG